MNSHAWDPKTTQKVKNCGWNLKSCVYKKPPHIDVNLTSMRSNPCEISVAATITKWLINFSSPFTICHIKVVAKLWHKRSYWNSSYRRRIGETIIVPQLLPQLCCGQLWVVEKYKWLSTTSYQNRNNKELLQKIWSHKQLSFPSNLIELIGYHNKFQQKICLLKDMLKV